MKHLTVVLLFESIEIPDSVTMSAGAFYHCKKLNSVKLPLNWTSVPDYSYDRIDLYSDDSDYYCSPFIGCTSLKKRSLFRRNFKDHLKQAFRKLIALETVNISDSVETIGAYAFYGCDVKIKTISLNAFNGCKSYQVSI